MNFISLKSHGDFFIAQSLIYKFNLNVSSYTTNFNQDLNKNFLKSHINFIKYNKNIVPELFDVKKNKLLDVYKCIKYFRNKFSKKKFDIFFTYDNKFRYHLCGLNVNTIKRGNSNIYDDFKYFFEEYTNQKFQFNIAKKSKSDFISIFPSSRVKLKELDKIKLKKIVDFLNQNNKKVKIFIHKIHYSNFNQLKKIISKSDKIICTDSLIKHIAQHKVIDHFCVYKSFNSEWATPSIRHNGYYMEFNDINTHNMLALKKWIS